MRPPLPQLLLTLLIALAAGLGGALIGSKVAGRGSAPVALHDIVHAEFDLSPAQRTRLDALERSFAIVRQRREAEMRAANAELATAIAAERGYGVQVTAAVDHSHIAMGALQKATIEHVFAMRAVLTPAQAARFDRTVVGALTETPA